jgi:deoxyribose-phosphate aldolase
MAAVCIFPHYVPWLAKSQEHSGEDRDSYCLPFSFTFGNQGREMRAAARGADEADFVINIALLKSGDEAAVEKEMQYLSDASRALGVSSKFIIETGYLNDDEKIRVCRIANRVRPDFMKTSTGYGPSGAQVEDVRLMREALLPEIRIKASGGIRSHKQALALLQAGASRIGTSSGVVIVEESRKV